MSPVTVFIRTLLKSSAIFIGTAAIFLHPQLEWRAAGTEGRVGVLGGGAGVIARQAPTEAAIDGLIALLKDPDVGVRRQAVRSLASLNGRRAAPALAAAMKDSDPEMRAAIVSALGELGDAQSVPALSAALKDESIVVRARAASALGEIGDRSAVDGLIAAAKDKSPEVRKRA